MQGSRASSGERPSSIEVMARDVSIGRKLHEEEKAASRKKESPRREPDRDRTISPILKNDDTMPLSLSITMAQELLGQLSISPVRPEQRRSRKSREKTSIKKSQV